MSRTLAVSIVTACNIVLAVALQFYVLARFGVGVETDAHVASQTVPLMVTSLLVATLPQAIVPIVVAESDPRATTWSITWRIASVALPLALVLVATAGAWVPVLFGGLDDATIATSITLTQIQLSTVCSAALVAAPLALLYAERRVLASETTFLVASIATLVAMPFACAAHGIIGASYTLAARSFVQAALIFPLVGRPRGVAIPNRDVGRRLWHLLKPLLFGAPLFKLGPVVDRLVGSLAPSGQMTLLIYGQHAWGMGLTLIDRTIAKPALADQSALSAAGKRLEARVSYFAELRRSLTVAAIGFIAFCAMGKFAMDFFAAFTQLSHGDANQLYLVCVVLGGVLVAGAAGQVSAATMYAMGRAHAVTQVAVVTFLMATLVKVGLVGTFGIYGVAVGAVFYQLANAIALHRRTVREFV